MRLGVLTADDEPLLLVAGFKTQGLWQDLKWNSSLDGRLWQASTDEGEFIRFYEHDADLRRMPSRTMKRAEFQVLFGI